MSREKAIVHHAGHYMLKAKAEALFDAEGSKGCDGTIFPHPLALEPVFSPITGPRDVLTLNDGPGWVCEHPPNRQDVIRYQVWISPEQPFDWNCFELFIRQLSLVSNRVGLEIAGNRERIAITLLCHHQDCPVVTTAFSSKLRFCKLSVVEPELIFGPTQKDWNNISFYDYFPPSPYAHLLTRPDELYSSPYEALVTAIANIPKVAVGIYQVLFQPVSRNNNWHRNIEILTDLEYVFKMVGNLGMGSIGHAPGYTQQTPSGALGQMTGEVNTKAHNDKPLFATAFRIAVVGAVDNRDRYLQSLAVFSSLFQHSGRPLNYISEADYSSVLSPEQIQQMFLLGLTYRPGFLVNSAELTGLVHFPPTSIVEQIGINIDTVETLAVIADDELADGTPIGTTSIAGQERLVCIPQAIRMRHTHVIGAPDQGKSTVMEHMIMDNIRNGHGVAVLDPHHDMVDRLLRLIPQDAVERVIYFDPSNPEWIPVWNPLARIPGQDIGRMTDDLIGVFKSFVEGWGDRMEHLFRHAIFGLLHISGSTLRDVYDILRNSDESKEMRKLVLEVVQNDLVREFWKHDITDYRAIDLGPPKHKLSKLLLSNTAVSLMLSQPGSSFSIRRIMDEGLIFLADLSPKLGKETKEILGGFLVAVMYLTTLSRSDKLREKRKPFHMYLDEAYHFVTDTFEETIAEARKYGVSLTFAHQYLRQFDAKKISALGTIGTLIAFNVDTGDASHLSKYFKKKVEVNDIIDLAKGEAIMRCGTNIVKMKTLKPLEIPAVNFKDRIIAESRKKYCMPASEVRKIIARRSERANKPYAPLVPVSDNRKESLLSEELKRDRL